MQEKINKIIWRIFVLLVIGLLGLIVFQNYHNKNTVQAYNKKIFYMDTYIYVNVYLKDQKKAENALKHVEEMYRYYHELTTRFESYDGIHNPYYIKNNSSQEEYITIDKELYHILTLAKEWYQKSDGLIDISMGNVIDIWKKYRDQESGVPSLTELQQANTDTIDDIVLKDGNKIKNNHVNIDLGAIAKGYATDKVAEYLKKEDITMYLINAGGNVLVGDSYQEGSYKIGIEDPSNSSKGIFIKVMASNKAVVTSGGYERFYEYEGKKYHHVIHPDTLFPSDRQLSVTVISDNSTEADILSTMLFLMDTEEGKKYVDSHNDLEAIWYIDKEEQVESNDFKKYVIE